MKIVAVLERSITSGGEFNQGLNTIIQLHRICEGRFDFEIFTSHIENIAVLEKLGFSGVTFGPPLPEELSPQPEEISSLLEESSSLTERVPAFMERVLFLIKKVVTRANFASRWLARENRKIIAPLEIRIGQLEAHVSRFEGNIGQLEGNIGRLQVSVGKLEGNMGKFEGSIGWFEKKLIEHNADIVYFLTQSMGPEPLQKLNYITTVFDLCHRDTPEFPEVRIFGQFQGRELHCKNHLAQALLVVTESENLANLVSKRYGIDRTRCLAIPMSPAPLLGQDFSDDKFSVLQKYNLEAGYFFYPAQFWSHKNHVRILEALVLLRETGNNFRVVFAGSDKGNQEHIENLVSQYSLNDQVKFLGFVPVEHMRGLYEGCAAVVMPTYFGPTNLPPMEAWMIGKPLIYSAHLKEQAGDAAVYANPDSAMELAEAMKAVTDPEAAARLIAYGTLRLRQLEQQRERSETELTNRLLQFEARRRCWT
jgi:glycosyltransferase involved in cell wall biosynthesis